MHILHVSWEYPPVIYGGLGRHVLALTQAQAAAGHAVTVITQRPQGTPVTEECGGVRVVRTADVTPPVRRDVAGLMQWTADLDAQLARTVAACAVEPPAVAHVHDWVVERAAQTAAERWAAPVVATIHATEAGRHAGWITGEVSESVYAAEWRLARRATALITCSRAMAIEIGSLYQAASERVFTIPNGIDLARWSVESASSPGEADAGRPGPGASDRGDRPGRHPLILFVGRLEWEKGVQVLIAAAKLLPPGTAADIVIAGVGTQAAHFRELAAGSARVRFAGQVPDPELRELLDRAATVVVPSLYEPFGIVALEAAAAGTPLIVSDVGGLAEIVANGETGLVVPPNDPTALAKAISAVLVDPTAARARATRLRSQLPARYCWDRIAERTTEVYRRARALPRPTPVPPDATAPKPTGQLLACDW